MHKKIYLFFILILFFVFNFLETFALDGKINVQNQGNMIRVILEVKSDSGKKSSIKEIKGLEQFDILSQSQSTGSSGVTVITNGKIQSKISNVTTLSYLLRAKKSGELTIGPAIISDGNEEIKTNSVKIKVANTGISIGKKIGGTIKTIKNDLVQNKDKIEDDNIKNDNVENKFIGDRMSSKLVNNFSNIIYILIGVLVASGIGFYFILKKNPDFLIGLAKKINENNLKNKENNIKNINIAEEKNEKKLEIKKQDFEKEEKIEISYPEITDKNFIVKIEKSLREKIKQKFNIKNVESKTFLELQEEIGNKLDLNVLFSMINKAKYSNIITDFSKILEKVKNI